MTTSMPARMLRLLSLLQGRREWSGAELADRLGVTGRTVRRDIGRLRELGYPVDATTGTAGGYRLASGRNLPPLLLDDDEAVAVAVGLRTAAGGSVSGIEETSVRALAKLEQVLPARLRHQIAAVGEATVPVRLRDGPRVDPATLALLGRACRDGELVGFDYRGREGVATARRVEPHSLVTLYGHWYLVAYDPGRADWRTFRLDRLARPAATHRRFAPRELPDGDAAAFLVRTLGAAPYRFTAAATLPASAETVTARMHTELPGTITPVDGHTCRIRLGADSLDLVAQSLAALAALGLGISVEARPEVLERLRTVGRQLADGAQG